LDRGGEWRAGALRAFDWFLGENDLRKTLIDPDTGSCSDGLHPDRLNQNKGAESALSYLLGLVEMRQFERPATVERKKLASQLLSRREDRAIAPRTTPGGPFVSIPLLESPDPASATRSSQGRRETLQTGN
jgi:hypothetical protein